MENNQEVTINKSTKTNKKVTHDKKNANIWSPGHHFISLVNHILMNYWTSHDKVSRLHPRLFEPLRASIFFVN